MKQKILIYGKHNSMTKYSDLTKEEQIRINKEIIEKIEKKHHINTHNNFEWDEPDWTLNNVHSDNYCAKCWMPYYNCLCSHDD